MTSTLQSSSRYILSLSLVFILSFVSFIPELEACNDPPEIPPGVTVTGLDDFGALFEIRLDGYTSFGATDGTHFCVCGISFLNTFPFEIIDVFNARLVLAGTDMTFETFDFSNDDDTTGAWEDLDLGGIWFGMFATVNGAIDPDVPVDLVFTIAVDFFPSVNEKQKLTRSQLLATEAEVLGAIGHVATDEGDAAGVPTGGHQAVFNIQTALPVELVDFGASLKSSGVVLEWKTLSETDNSGFEVQHSDGSDFSDIGFVAGHGNSTEEVSYSFTSQVLESGKHFFRLKQIDFDGRSTLSPTVEVDIDIPGNFVVHEPYPNPFNASTQILYSVKSSQNVKIGMYDILGQEFHSENRFSSGGQTQRVLFNAENIPSGVYLIQVQGENFKKSFTVNLVR